MLTLVIILLKFTQRYLKKVRLFTQMTNLKAIYKQIFQEKFHLNYLYVFLSLSKILLHVLLVLLPEGKKTYNY